jgi:large subunit ribosomal protein L6
MRAKQRSAENIYLKSGNKNMSRLIKKSIAIPDGVTVVVTGDVVVIKGPKGELTLNAPFGVEVAIEAKEAWVKPSSNAKSVPNSPALLGTTWALLRNAIEGVSNGFMKILEIEGVGYRAAIEGKDLVLHLGYALPVRMPVLEGVTVIVEKNTIKVSGINKEVVGQAAAEIRALKKPEPYKGKGIHYQGEVIRRKVGKKAGTAS